MASGRFAIGGYRIEAVLTGRAAPLRGAQSSAISKSQRRGRVAVTSSGLDTDEQADRVNHGGPDMAVHHYPRDHYAYWAARIPDRPLLGQAGTFGENISVSGLLEGEACIGDRYRLGSALVEISQGRKPCWKPAHRLAAPRLLADMVASGRCGWYYRVLEPGFVSADDMLCLVDRPEPGWPVSLVFSLIVAGHWKHDPALLPALAAVPALAANWRHRALALGAE